MTTAPEHVRDLVEQILRTGLALTNALTVLLDDLPEDAFPGEEPGEVLIEMVSGTLQPAADAAGEPLVRQSTAFLAAVQDRVVADLQAAAATADE